MEDKINIVLGGHRVYNELFANYANVEIIINVLNESYDCDGRLANANIFNSNQEEPYVIPRITLPELTQYVTPGLYNSDEWQYIRLLEELINEPETIQTRSGPVRKNNNTHLSFNMANGFPLLTTKFIKLSSVFEELMFFIRGQTNTKILEAKGIPIWKGNTTREFLDARGLDYPEGEMGPMYGHQWRNFNGVDQIQRIINILSTDPNSRRICITSYNPADLDRGALEPCHGVSIIFNTKHVEGNTYMLNLMQTQRSADMFLGLPYNIASYALMLHLIADYVTRNSIYTYIPDTLVVNISDYHLYENHIAQAKRQCLRIPKKFPTLKVLENNVNNINDYEFDNILLENYNPYKYIQADMSP
jgi:thymidylate synthase